MIKQNAKRGMAFVIMAGCGVLALAGCGQKAQPLPGTAPSSAQVLTDEQTKLNDPNLSPVVKANLRRRIQQAQSKPPQ